MMLVGCINLTFDALEFDRYLTIREIAVKANTACDTPDFPLYLGMLKSEVDHQVTYSNYRSGGRPNISSAATELKTIVDGLYDKYKATEEPSAEYCRQKTNNISTGAEIIVKELGKL